MTVGPPTGMAGYSGTPLPRNLGLTVGQRIRFVNAPDGWDDLIGPLPDGAVVVPDGDNLDFVILFALQSDDIRDTFSGVAEALAPAGMLWIAWPKTAAKYDTDLTGNRVRQLGLASGLVDVKVCAIDDFWSGLKFVRRLTDR